MKKIILLIISIITILISYGQNQKFQINGAARGYMFANELGIAEDIDTVSIRKANYGHTLLDLGISAYPNDKTEVIGMFRLVNQLGGFWGGGTYLYVRQLTLKGVAGDIVRYELGDIDHKMTPYTLYNTTEEGVVNEADAFALRREIIHYEMFYNNDNSWRMQGAKVDFGLEFPKYINSIDFNGFITRQRTTDGISSPERLYGGGSITLHQSDEIKIGINNINLFDLTQTTEDSIQFTNSINTLDGEFLYEINEEVKIGIKGEAGISYVEYKNDNDFFAPEKYDDTFLDVALTSELDRFGLNVDLGFKDIGPDFLSAGAQTKRINYEKFPGLYQQYTNNYIGRKTNYFDIINGVSENSYKISEVLMTYNAAYNNSNPYGVATPNRRGIYLDVVKKDTTKFKENFIHVAMLQEIIGSGTIKKKNFLVARAGTDIYINDFLGWEKWLKLDLGVGFEKTTRSGEEYEKVDLNSTLIEGGVTFEFLENFDLLTGIKLWNVSGNEFLTDRNAYNTVIDFYDLDYNLQENSIALGLRYRFNDETALSAQYQTFDLSDKSTGGIDYSISQFNILYNMFF